ncbi:hypothetical protein BOX15_Mlig001801g2 [Macrostomum lignano]|uniref:Uncharacterized protein n=2 Tax=Macrostomum lignano TaxID=282301 RepID=A0A1I8G0T0_9PLAT|nr:hypothetical protein BOX15_Mlig001801g1 [Macrostomum lignano]PAA89378.1 hypothetical protein BOX15_Mlig001801g2 [Macrostomum lignano]
MNFLGIRGAGAALLLVLLIAAAQLQVSQSRSLRPSSYFEEDQQLIDDDSNEFADSDCDDLDSVDDCGDDTRREPPARADDDWVRSEPSRRSDLRKRYDPLLAIRRRRNGDGGGDQRGFLRQTSRQRRYDPLQFI